MKGLSDCSYCVRNKSQVVVTCNYCDKASPLNSNDLEKAIVNIFTIVIFTIDPNDKSYIGLTFSTFNQTNEIIKELS